MKCEHMDFNASVAVGRILDDETKKLSRFTADIRVECAECGQKFRFLGLQPGYDPQGARCSLDGLEARIAITPEGMKASPLQQIMNGQFS